MEKLDVVYLAPDMGSLFGAVALAAGGLKVLVLDGDPRKMREKRTEKEGVWPKDLPTEPFLLRGLRSGGFLEPLLNRLGLLNKARDMVERLDPSFQVVTPDSRVDIWSSKDGLGKEFAREFGAASKPANALFAGFEGISEEVYRLVGSEGFPVLGKGFGAKLFKRSSADHAVAALRSEPLANAVNGQKVAEPFRRFIYGALVGLGAPSSQNISLAAAATIMDSARRGVYRADKTELNKLILSAFKSKGGYTFPLIELESIELSNRGELTALRMPKGNVIRSKLHVGSAALVANYLPPEAARAILPAGNPRLHRLEIMLASEAVPVGMQERVCILTRKADVIFPENVVRVSISGESDIEGKKVRVVTAESIRPGVDDIQSELHEHLGSVIPFLDEFEKNHRYSVESVSFSLDSKTSFLDLPPLGPIENLLPLENEILTGMGLGMEVISGRILARIILKKLGLKAEI